jgi:hypothetical protein
MSENLHTALRQGQGSETTDEIIGVLTAISVVSKRLAKRLTLLEQRSAEKEGAKKDGTQRPVSTHGD